MKVLKISICRFLCGQKKKNSNLVSIRCFPYSHPLLFMICSPWLSGEESAYNAGVTGATGSIPGPGRAPGGGHGNPLQYSCLENPMDRGAWQATVHGVTKNWIRLRRHGTRTHSIVCCSLVYPCLLFLFHET